MIRPPLQQPMQLVKYIFLFCYWHQAQQCRESLLKGKNQNNFPTCTYLFKAHSFILRIFFTKQTILTRRSTVVSFPLVFTINQNYNSQNSMILQEGNFEGFSSDGQCILLYSYRPSRKKHQHVLFIKW